MYEFMLQKFSNASFLTSADIQAISKHLSLIPQDYITLSKNIADWWNYFQLKVDFGGLVPFDIGISIKKIFEILIVTHYPVEKIETSRFIDATKLTPPSIKDIDTRYLFYSSPKDNIEVKDEPIIVLKEFDRMLRVIDGNHRVDEAINRQKPYLEAFIIDSEFLLQNDCFQTEYDRHIYCAYKLFYEAYLRTLVD